MIRYCTICAGPINDEVRIKRGSPYCSPEHKLLADRQRRTRAAGKKCRLCGRGIPRVTLVAERKLRRKLADLVHRALPFAKDSAAGSSSARSLVEDAEAVLRQNDTLEASA